MSDKHFWVLRACKHKAQSQGCYTLPDFHCAYSSRATCWDIVLALYCSRGYVPCISHHVRSDCGPNSMSFCTSHTCIQAASGNLQKPLEFLVFLHAPPKGGSYSYRQNLTVIEKTFKTLVKMNNSAMWPSASPSPARSGPRRPSRIPRGPPSETIGIPCVSEVPPLEFHFWPRCPGWCTDPY